MADVKEHRKSVNVIVILLVLLAMFCRNAQYFIIKTKSMDFAAGCMRGSIYIGLFTFWGISVRQRIIQIQVRRYLEEAAALMVFWIIVRTIKFFSDDCSHIGRYCWYLYYFPMLFIPLLSLFVSLSLGKSENFRLPRWIYFPVCVSGALLVLVLTNDLHQCTFSFSNGLKHFGKEDYSYEIIYCLCVGWIVLCVCASLVCMVVRSHVPGSKKRSYLPCILLALLGIYGFLYTKSVDIVYLLAGDMTVVICLFVMAVLESCIQCGLIQSNTYYNELFSGSKIKAVIVDNDYNIQFETEAEMNLSQELMQEAEHKPVSLCEGMVLESMSLGDGHILWIEDLTELKRLHKELESNAAVLSEEAELLSEEIRQKEEKAVTDIRNRLYDTIAGEIAPQIEEINRLISKRSENTEIRKKTLKKICVLGAYVKRRCNLIFLNVQLKSISTMELYYCLQESAEYIIQYGIPCSVEHISEGSVSIENAKLAYDYFEAVAEMALETMHSFSVCIIAAENGLELQLTAECADAELYPSGLCSRIEQAGGFVKTDKQNGVWSCTLVLP